jgi:hypothetical protein
VDNAAGDLHQRGLARAVLADEAEHRTRRRIEADIDDGARRAELLVDGLERQHERSEKRWRRRL